MVGVVTSGMGTLYESVVVGSGVESEIVEPVPTDVVDVSVSVVSVDDVVSVADVAETAVPAAAQ